MARTLYAGRPGDYFVDSAGRPLRRAAAPVYQTSDASSPVTDLLDEAGLPVTAVTSDAAGGFTFSGPENYRGVLYLRDQNGRYKLVEPADMAARVEDLETSLDATVAAALVSQVPTVLGVLGAVANWAPEVDYTIGVPVLNPEGDVARANAAHTSASVYDPTKWTVSTTASDDAAAKIDALIAAAPGALDTLNELAAALGDDPDFAVTVVTSLAAKLDAATAAATYVPKWKPTTDYLADAPVVNPAGDVVKRKAAGTSRATYDVTEAALWAGSSTYAPVVPPTAAAFAAALAASGPRPSLSTKALGCTGVTDDTALVQGAIDALTVAGGGSLVVDCPVLLNGTSTGSGIQWAVGISGDNLTIEGVPGGKLIRTLATGAMFLASGGGKVAAMTAWGSNKFDDAATYPIAAAVKGALSVTCVTPANAGNFAAGDYAYLHTGACIAFPGNFWLEADAELMQVSAVNAGTGVVTLRRPLGKAYAQEYYATAAQDTASTTTVTAWPALLGISKVTGRVMKNLRFRNLLLDSAALDRNIISGWQIDGWEISDCRGEGNGGLQTGRDFINYSFRNNVFHSRGATQPAMDYIMAVASGCGDGEFEHNRITSDHTAFEHVHEGTVRHRSKFNTYLGAANDGTKALIDVRGRAHDPEIIGNKLAGAGYGIFVDSTCVDGGMIDENATLGGILTGAIRIDNPATWRVGPKNNWQSGTVSLISNISAPSGALTASGWVTFAAKTRTLLVPEPNCVITGIKIFVTDVFDAAATISVGISGDAGRYANAVDVTTMGTKTVTDGTGANVGHYITGRLAIFVTVNGSPTVGKAIVVVTIAPAPTKP